MPRGNPDHWSNFAHQLTQNDDRRGAITNLFVLGTSDFNQRFGSRMLNCDLKYRRKQIHTNLIKGFKFLNRPEQNGWRMMPILLNTQHNKSLFDPANFLLRKYI